jgi:hypothetical protein
MKRVSFSSLLVLILLFFFSKTDAQSNIIGNPIKIGNIEVAQYDFRKISWVDANNSCINLGDGWRLPSIEELKTLYQNREVLGNFKLDSYWSSTKGNVVIAWRLNFDDGMVYDKDNTDNTACVRAVRFVSSNSTNAVANNNYIPVSDLSRNSFIGSNSVELNKQEFEKLLAKYNSTTSYNSTFSGNIKPYPSNPSESFYKKDYYNNQLIYDGYMKKIVTGTNGNTVYQDVFKHGRGKEYFINSNSYLDGYFINGKLNGYGEHVSQGFSYKGYFINGVRSGEGILVMDGTNGTTKYIYEGMFSNGVYNGKGTLTYNFMAYTGTFVGGVISGLGVYLYPDGSKYVGNSLNGKYEGHGEYYSANGNYYVGNFYNGSYNGLGELIYANGTKLKGVFENNVYKGEKKEVSNNYSTTVQNSSNSNENQSPSKQYSSNQKCNVTFNIPVLPFKYVDNRVLCIYCGTRYIPYSKIDVNEYKKGMTLTYVSKQIDKHCEKVGADNNHKASHIIQIGDLCVKKGYFKTTEDAVATIITGNFIGKQVSNYFEGITSMLNILQQALGSSTQNNQANEFAIKLYDNNNTKFCTREHEDRYNRRY